MLGHSHSLRGMHNLGKLALEVDLPLELLLRLDLAHQIEEGPASVKRLLSTNA